MGKPINVPCGHSRGARTARGNERRRRQGQGRRWSSIDWALMRPGGARDERAVSGGRGCAQFGSRAGRADQGCSASVGGGGGRVPRFDSRIKKITILIFPKKYYKIYSLVFTDYFSNIYSIELSKKNIYSLHRLK